MTDTCEHDTNRRLREEITPAEHHGKRAGTLEQHPPRPGHDEQPLADGVLDAPPHANRKCDSRILVTLNERQNAGSGEMD